LIDLFPVPVPAAGVDGFEPRDIDHKSSKLALEEAGLEFVAGVAGLIIPILEPEPDMDIGRIGATPPNELLDVNDGEGRCIPPPAAIPPMPMPMPIPIPIPIPEFVNADGCACIGGGCEKPIDCGLALSISIKFILGAAAGMAV